MKAIYIVRYGDGREPVTEFLDAADPKVRAKLERVFKQLLLQAIPLTEPHVKHFGLERYSRFYELREKVRVLVRIIFTLDAQDNIILLHPFVKKHNRNTMQALEASIRLLDDVEAGNAEPVPYRYQREVRS